MGGFFLSDALEHLNGSITPVGRHMRMAYCRNTVKATNGSATISISSRDDQNGQIVYSGKYKAFSNLIN